MKSKIKNSIYKSSLSLIIISSIFAIGCDKSDTVSETENGNVNGTEVVEVADEIPNDQVDSNLENNLNSTIHVDSKLPESVIEAVEFAAFLWHDATNGKVNIDVVITDEVVSDYSVTSMQSLSGSRTLAFCSGNSIYINPDTYYTQYFNAVMVHEFGHYLGLGHKPGFNDSVMNPYINRESPVYPTEDAIQDLKQLYNW